MEGVVSGIGAARLVFGAFGTEAATDLAASRAAARCAAGVEATGGRAEAPRLSGATAELLARILIRKRKEPREERKKERKRQTLNHEATRFSFVQRNRLLFRKQENGFSRPSNYCDGPMVRSRSWRTEKGAVRRKPTLSETHNEQRCKNIYSSDKVSQKGTHSRAPARAPTDAPRANPWRPSAPPPPRRHRAAAHAANNPRHTFKFTFKPQRQIPHKGILPTGHMTQHESQPRVTTYTATCATSQLARHKTRRYPTNVFGENDANDAPPNPHPNFPKHTVLPMMRKTARHAHAHIAAHARTTDNMKASKSGEERTRS